MWLAGRNGASVAERVSEAVSALARTGSRTGQAADAGGRTLEVNQLCGYAGVYTGTIHMETASAPWLFHGFNSGTPVG